MPGQIMSKPLVPFWLRRRWVALVLVLLLGLLLPIGRGLQVLPFIMWLALAVAAFYWTLVPSSFHLIGPLFFYDLVRLARRGRSILLRVSFAVVLFAGLCFIYNERFPQQQIFRHPFAPGPTVAPSEVGQFANVFANVILTLQGLAVLVLTPAYLAGAIAEEKEHRTLELLFTTHLTDQELVLGKLCSRLTHLAGVLMVSLPILSILQLWGGTNPLVILAAYAVCGFSLLSIGSLSILCSVIARNVLNAVLLTYSLVLVGSFCCLGVPGFYASSPLAFLGYVEEQMGTNAFGGLLFLGGGGLSMGRAVPAANPLAELGVMVLTYGFVHLLIALFCLSVAVAVVRSAALGQTETGPLRPPPVEPLGVRAVRPRQAEADGAMVRRRPLPREPRGEFYHAVPVGDNALFWKEVYHEAYTIGSAIVMVVVSSSVVLILALMALFAFWQTGDLATRVVNPTVRGACLVLAGFWATSVAFLAGRSITREREMRTLDSLLSLPVEREIILRAKWLGSVLRGRALGFCLAGFLALGLLSGAVHPLGVLLMALAIGVHIAFLASLGICLSLVCRNTLWANLTMALMLLLVFAGSSVVLMYSSALGGPVAFQTAWSVFSEFGLNPPRAWWHLGFTWAEFEREILLGPGLFRGTYGATLLGLLIFAVAAGVFWMAARAQFRREQVRDRK
jgi:ABC-type transport system involved in multi-copper enzyme maturation permease subunit